MPQLLLLADYEGLASEIAVVIVGFYAFLIVVALLLKAFRSWIGLVVAFVMSAIASLPAADAFSQVLKYPNILNRQTVTEYLQATSALLIFVWAAPVIQYLIIRYRRRKQQKESLT